MSYQAVIRNSSDELLTSHAAGMRISILNGSETGTSVYTETQTPTTNTNGLVSLEIGGGTVVNGIFADINWTSGTYFIKTETDPTGGTSYTIAGTCQLLSVPYALNANNGITTDEKAKLAGLTNADGSETKVTAGTNVTVAGSGTTANPYVINASGGGGGSHYLGEEYLGGIIFYLYTDNTGTQKGLIAMRSGGNTLLSSTAEYWSSTEFSATAAFSFLFRFGSITNYIKINPYSVRAIRAF